MVVEKKKITWETLKDRGEKYCSITQKTEDGIALIQDEIIKYCNPSLAKMRGDSINNILNHKFSEYISPIETKKINEYYKKRILGKKVPSKYEAAFIRKDGSTIFVELNARIVQNEGKPADLVVIRDITERKKEDEKLKESEEKFRSIFEHSAVGVSIVSLEGKWLQVNAALCKMTGYSEKELLSRGYLQLTFPEDVEKTKKLTQDLLSGNKNYGYLEKRYLTKDKKIIWVYLSITLVRDLNNKPQYYVVHTEDITEKKEVEIRLKKNQENLKQLVKKKTFELEKEKNFLNMIVENIPNMIFVKDAEKLKFQLFNKEGEKLLGKKKEFLLGKNDYDFFPKSQADFFTQKDRQVLKNKKLLDIPEEPIKTPFGERILHTKKIPILDKEGKPEFLLGISDDITDKINTEKKYGELFENASDAIFIADSKTKKLIDCNKVAEKLIGYSKKEILSMYAHELHPKDRQDETMKAFNSQFHGKLKSFLTEVLTKDKRRIPVSINASIVKVGGIIYSQGIFRDITEQEKGKETEEKYKTLYQSSADAIMTLEPPSWNFTAGNSATIKMFNVKDEKEFISKAPWEYSPVYQPDGQLSSVKAKKMIDKAMKEGKNYFEWIHKRNNGENFSATVLLSRINRDKKSYLQATVRDITEQKKMEAKARESEVVKTEFLSAISHELRTPITPIKAQIQRMLSTELNKDEQMNSLEIALRNTLRIDRLIQDLLEISRIKSGKFDIFKRQEDLNEIIRETIIDLNSFAKEKKTKIIFKEGKIPKVNIDKDRILEVIINVLDNAIKYSRGKILIKTERKYQDIIITIRDNGRGILKEDYEKIFTPFYHSGEFKTKKYDGTGLGLSISKGIIEAHNGKIWLESEVGKWTTFFIKLPAK